MADVLMTLSAYLESVSRGRFDCCTFMADWLVESGLADPMLDRRGTYSTRKEYRRLIKSEGGLLASCVKRFAAIGLHETSDPVSGDVAIVSAPIAIRRGTLVYGPTGAICTTKTMRAVVARDVALAVADLQTIKAWAVNG